MSQARDSEAAQRALPNILVIIADQLVADLTGPYGSTVAQTPHMDRLADQGVKFEASYCPYPVCSPSRSSLLSGRFASVNSAWDNASPIASDIPMLPHYLTQVGYECALAGKMHFVGADQLHGFHKRLTTDMFPSTLAWTPNRDEVGRFVHPGNPDGPPIAVDYVHAGPAQWNEQLQFDEETHYRSLEYLRGKRTERGGSMQTSSTPQRDTRPWLLVSSYHHPHEPFQPPRKYWDMYADVDVDDLKVPADSVMHSVMDRWVETLHGADHFDVEAPENIRTLRRAYLALVTYIDDKVGELLDTLEETGNGSNTLVILTSDHGDMLGERGMVQKRTFYEWSARIPLIVSGAGVTAKGATCETPVSLIDLVPTICDIVGVDPVRPDGTSFASALVGDGHERDAVYVEYHSEGVYAPCWMRREGKLKYTYIHGHGHQLFDLESDPLERHDVSDDPRYAEAVARAQADLLSRFDPDDIERRIRDSIADRRVVRDAMTATNAGWSYDPPPDVFTQYWRTT